jgi:hypothetical protein
MCFIELITLQTLFKAESILGESFGLRKRQQEEDVEKYMMKFSMLCIFPLILVG